MKNPALRSLNFKDLLCYQGEILPEHFYSSPRDCSAFCIECERSGAAERAGGKLTLMSHGCDTFDFEFIFGRELEGEHLVQDPVLILLENPGGDYSLGVEISYQGVKKKPPVNHYYFSSGLKDWPEEFEDLDGNFYGSYFAYIIKRHGLKNAYITNLVKCKSVASHSPYFIENSCVETILSRELAIFQPKLALCFSRKVHNSFRRYFPNINSVYLSHPSWIQNRSYTQGLSPKEAIQINDERIALALSCLNNLVSDSKN